MAISRQPHSHALHRFFVCLFVSLLSITTKQTKDNSSDEDEDSESDSESANGKRIPHWAKGPQLSAALQAQYAALRQKQKQGQKQGQAGAAGAAGSQNQDPNQVDLSQLDPDQIFNTAEVSTCDLEKIFGSKANGKKSKKYVRRTSSGNWVPDRLTLQVRGAKEEREREEECVSGRAGRG